MHSSCISEPFSGVMNTWLFADRVTQYVQHRTSPAIPIEEAESRAGLFPQDQQGPQRGTLSRRGCFAFQGQYLNVYYLIVMSILYVLVYIEHVQLLLVDVLN